MSKRLPIYRSPYEIDSLMSSEARINWVEADLRAIELKQVSLK